MSFPAYRATLLNTKVTASNFCFMQYFNQRLFGSDWDLVDSKSLLLLILGLIHRPLIALKLTNQYCVTSLPCWGRVVIGSLFVYQTIGAGSNPVASTTVLNVSARSIGNGQCG